MAQDDRHGGLDGGDAPTFVSFKFLQSDGLCLIPLQSMSVSEAKNAGGNVNGAAMQCLMDASNGCYKAGIGMV